jgi:hypothetical protein
MQSVTLAAIQGVDKDRRHSSAFLKLRASLPRSWPHTFLLYSLHQPRRRNSKLRIEHLLSRIILGDPPLIGRPAHAFWLRRQIPLIRIFISEQSRFHLRFRALCPPDGVKELRGIGSPGR